MRRWLTQKKQSLGHKLKNSENEDQAEETELELIIKKIVEKAEFLVALQ